MGPKKQYELLPVNLYNTEDSIIQSKKTNKTKKEKQKIKTAKQSRKKNRRKNN